MSHDILRHTKARHRKHRFFFVTAVFVAIISMLGISVVSFQAYGASIMMSLTIADPNAATVTSQPPTAIVDVVGSAPLLAYVGTPTVTTDETADIEPLPGIETTVVTINLLNFDGTLVEDGHVSTDGRQTAIPAVTSSRPRFSGNVGVSNAFIFVELQSDLADHFTSSLYADDNGNWSWTSPRTIADGPHTFYIAVFDPTGSVKLASSNLQFIVDSGTKRPESTSPLDEPIKNVSPSFLEQRRALFDVNVKLLGDSQMGVAPGDDLLTEVRLLNIGAPGTLQDVTVHYRIYDKSDKLIHEEDETVAVSTQTSFLKVFSTKPSFAVGDYRLEVGIKYNDAEAISATTFHVGGDPVLTLPGRTRVNVTFVLQSLLTILGTAVLVGYMEYHQAESLRHVLRQFSEQELSQKGYFKS